MGSVGVVLVPGRRYTSPPIWPELTSVPLLDELERLKQSYEDMLPVIEKRMEKLEVRP